VKAKCLRNIALIKQDQGNYSEALKFYKETLLIFKNYGLFEDPEIRHIEKKIKAIFSSFQKNYIPQRKEIIKSDLTKLPVEKVKKKEAEEKSLISSDKEILKNYEEALKEAEESGDLYKKLEIFAAIGEIYEKQGLYREAVKKYEDALEIASHLEDKSFKFKLVSKIKELYNKIFNAN